VACQEEKQEVGSRVADQLAVDSSVEGSRVAEKRVADSPVVD
jgi:hypothetical protein